MYFCEYNYDLVIFCIGVLLTILTKEFVFMGHDLLLALHGKLEINSVLLVNSHPCIDAKRIILLELFMHCFFLQFLFRVTIVLCTLSFQSY